MKRAGWNGNSKSNVNKSTTAYVILDVVIITTLHAAYSFQYFFVVHFNDERFFGATILNVLHIMSSCSIQKCRTWLNDQKEQVVSSRSQLPPICTLNWIFCIFFTFFGINAITSDSYLLFFSLSACMSHVHFYDFRSVSNVTFCIFVISFC